MVESALAHLPGLERLSLHGNLAWATLRMVLELIAGTGVRRVDVHTRKSEYAVEGDALLLEYLEADELVSLFGAGLRDGVIKRVRFPGRQPRDPLRWAAPDPAEVAQAKRYFERHRLGFEA